MADNTKYIGLFNRQYGIVKPDELPKSVLIIGAGGIGSWTTLCLAKMGVPKIYVVDHDVIEDVNVAPQFYGIEDISKSKADTVAEKVNKELGSEIVKPIGINWFDWEQREDIIESEMFDVCIFALDSLETRKKIWQEVKYAGFGLLIDARMAREQFEVLSILPDNKQQVEYYEQKRLLNIKSVAEVPCTERAVAYNQFVIAGIIGSQVKHYAKKELANTRIFADLYSASFETLSK